MAALRTSLVKRSHAWTGDDVPWELDADGAPSRLIRYLSGGGLSAFGSSSARTAVSRRQTRFLWVAAALSVLWLVFWIV